MVRRPRGPQTMRIPRTALQRRHYCASPQSLAPLGRLVRPFSSLRPVLPPPWEAAVLARRAPGVGGFPIRFATLRRRPYRCPVPSMPLRVLPILLLVVLNTLVHAVPLLLVGLVKAVLPLRPVWRACNPLLTGLAENWIAVNTWMIGAFTRTRFELE